MNVPPAIIAGNPTVISTFAGCGGSSLGYKWAGFRELLAIEWDDNAVATFKANFPDVPVWQRDIAKVDPAEVLSFCEIVKGELDILDGSPPCQGFSLAGKRRVSDPRNDLFRAFIGLIDGLRPRTFVMENVPGMAAGRMKGKFIEILSGLKSLGYNVACRKMNAMWYGVPQARRRLIFVGIRNDIGIVPSFPAPTVDRPVTFGEAVAGLIVSEEEVVKPSSRFIFKKFPVDKLAAAIPPGRKADDVIGGNRGFGLVRSRSDRPLRTVIKMFSPNLAAGLLHWSENRYLAISELK